jgi:hypothetical protein
MIQGKTHVVVAHGRARFAAEHMVGAHAIAAEQAVGDTGAVCHVAGAIAQCAAQIWTR